MHPIKQKKNAVGVCLYVPVLVCVHVCAEKYFLMGFTSKGYKLTYSLPLRHPAVFWRNHGDHSETIRSSHLELSRKGLQDPKQNVLRFPHTKHQCLYIYIYIWSVLLFIPLCFILKYLSIHCTSVHHLQWFFVCLIFLLPYQYLRQLSVGDRQKIVFNTQSTTVIKYKGETHFFSEEKSFCWWSFSIV